MKNLSTRKIIHLLLIVVGLILMIGGIITDKPGASVGGLIVAGVNVQQLIQWEKNRKNR